MGRFKKIMVPPQWKEYWTAYPHGYTILEALVDWLSEFNDIVDFVNNTDEYLQTFKQRFDKELQNEVVKTLKDWQQSGFLDIIIDEALQTQIDEVEKVVGDIQTSLNSKFINVTSPPYPLKKAVGDGVTDNTQILQDIISYCDANKLNVYIPEGEFVIKDTIKIGVNIKKFTMDGYIVYDGSHDRPALQVGDINDIARRNEYSLKVISKTQSNWSREDFIGIKLINLYECLITKLISNSFTIGVQCYATNRRGFVYNEIHLTTLYDNFIAVDLANETINSYGWVNENIFIGGRIGVGSGITIMPERIGVRIRSIDGTHPGNNNNYFLKTSFEMRGESIPIVVEHGFANQFDSIRSESNSRYIAKFLNDSSENVVNAGYTDKPPVAIDLSTSPTNYVTTRRFSFLSKFTQVFNSGNLKNMAIVDGDQVGFENVNVFDSSDGIPRQSTTDISLSPHDGIILPANKGVGVRVQTYKVKEFVVKINVLSSAGFFNIAAYDRDGNRLKGTNPAYVLGNRDIPLYYSNEFGGVYRPASKYDGERYFKVRDEVAYVDIIISGGDLVGFTVECIEQRRVAIPYKVL